MRRILLTLAAALAPLAAPGGGEAAAQGPYAPPTLGARPRPTISPYLNLLRPGGTASNYFNLTRPTFRIQNQMLNLEQEVTGAQQALTELEAGAGLPEPLPVTGANRPRFLDTGGYFMNIRGGTSRGGLGGFRAPQPAGGLPAGAAGGFGAPRPGAFAAPRQQGTPAQLGRQGFTAVPLR